jgi:hypothetical protein
MLGPSAQLRLDARYRPRTTSEARLTGYAAICTRNPADLEVPGGAQRAAGSLLSRDRDGVPVGDVVPPLDLFALTLERAGIPLDEYADSDAARLARGSWAPEVWE